MGEREAAAAAVAAAAAAETGKGDGGEAGGCWYARANGLVGL